MKSILVTASAFLLVMSPINQAKASTPDNVQTKNILCLDVSTNQTFANTETILLVQQPVDPVYIAPSTGPESKCTYYIVRGKDGKIYDCRKCTYGGPYCFRRE
ncbi:hypothetical protein MiYa_04149 [Microcystis aeruginosa NIES-2519]|jgi:hypothetical protein|uniref:Secreted protein n=1 Tax=Microcystis aeruginosa NIES-2519 TaxID=2303981 RepID=A0A5A5RJU2_MICAE|nr:hypothetical protein [Microcystis aeruginosa]GCA72596.1 hypothetical protein MiYa_04149 [Microcystis aeruginosa NIES-2519]